MAEDFTPRYESYPDRLIREAMERGDFADNPLRGKPVKLGRPGEQKSWIQERLEREDLSGILPPPLQLRREKARIARTLANVPTEQQARQIIDALNERIRDANLNPATQPRVVISLLDAEQALSDWRDAHPGAPSHGPKRGPSGPADGRADRPGDRPGDSGQR
ncbi:MULTISPECIES: DnaJ family domain-containing protein [Propionibacterium]|uniref:DnaJ homologue subfamily C member 28 conserved domain-containing protein n=1 Tax=Propionibacterium freudenreichii TaxID=1744 RepID=A0A2C7ZEC5_9ACTN|nr:DUF1992 domain-containing protein [Propionibacterium freudenreichii]MCT2975017.1 DUF1992 domain-containing protein [Propionibacterium freudenreichii]MCT2980067.1 DUF1992 domain-containing protein [Propionibacterium freudenreichii]MCT2997256.1 DUF1992 domain-containing protein [Propionibacterium freudenreichii]MCT2999628.1 DUF1992 domain-containing protein [Propionibacterium freudenreichii]MCT3001856.1 DUF1992 domain-containing protein [Propionibacterium freudenreichii]